MWFWWQQNWQQRKTKALLKIYNEKPLEYEGLHIAKDQPCFLTKTLSSPYSGYWHNPERCNAKVFHIHWDWEQRTIFSLTYIMKLQLLVCIWQQQCPKLIHNFWTDTDPCCSLWWWEENLFGANSFWIFLSIFSLNVGSRMQILSGFLFSL